jgi:hypothetical protein
MTAARAAIQRSPRYAALLAETKTGGYVAAVDDGGAAVNEYLTHIKAAQLPGCHDTAGMDAFDELRYLSFEDEAVATLATFRDAYQSQLVTLRAMKARGFNQRHPDVYARMLTRLRDAFDAENNTFREP